MLEALPMSYDLAYWVGMLLLVIAGALNYTAPNRAPGWRPHVFTLVLFFLLIVIGLKEFGKPLHP